MSTAPSPLRSLAYASLHDLRDALVSLKLTIVLLVFSMVLVFVATLDQVNLGIWAVQEKYFRTFIVWLRVGDLSMPAFPGGYTIGGLLLANLVAAHVYRFRFTWRKAGMLLTHFGLIVLLVGELLTGLWQEDYHMRLTEGETKSYAESFHFNELAFIDTSRAGYDEVVAIPEVLLAAKQTLQHPALPFTVRARTYFANSTLRVRAAGDAPSEASIGVGDQIAAAPLPYTYKQDERNVPTAFVELTTTTGPLGVYLASPHLAAPQEFTHEGRTWRIAFRAKRTYQPFSLTLLKFTHDRYPGTEIPRNFSSRLRLNTPDGRDDREVLIFMNNPLRYAGLTFYQAGFENDDRTTILQVVRNPSWLLPYVACGLMTLGLVVQFAIHLVGFVRKNAPAGPAVQAPPLPVPSPTRSANLAPAPALESLR